MCWHNIMYYEEWWIAARMNVQRGVRQTVSCHRFSTNFWRGIKNVASVRTRKTVHQYQVLEMCFGEYLNEICKWVLSSASVKANLHCVLEVPLRPSNGNTFEFSVDKKNQLDVSFCILYLSSNICSTCFGQPCAHHQELTTAWCYSLVLVCAVAAGRWSSPVGR